MISDAALGIAMAAMWQPLRSSGRGCSGQAGTRNWRARWLCERGDEVPKQASLPERKDEFASQRRLSVTPGNTRIDKNRPPAVRL